MSYQCLRFNCETFREIWSSLYFWRILVHHSPNRNMNFPECVLKYFAFNIIIRSHSIQKMIWVIIFYFKNCLSPTPSHAYENSPVLIKGPFHAINDSFIGFVCRVPLMFQFALIFEALLCWVFENYHERRIRFDRICVVKFSREHSRYFR